MPCATESGGTSGVPPIVGNHIDVRVGATVPWVGCANFEYAGWPARFIYQVMAVGISTPERREVPGAQRFFACVGYQRQLAIEHPDELVLTAVPVTLTGPSSRLDYRQVDSELSQPRIAR